MDQVGWLVTVASTAALLAVIAVLVAVVARQTAARASMDAEVARTSAGDADRSARFAAGRAKAMAEHRPLLESLLVEWGLRPGRARTLSAEIRDRVAQEIRAQSRVDGASSMTADQAERWRMPRDGGPAGSWSDGPSGTRQGPPVR